MAGGRYEEIRQKLVVFIIEMGLGLLVFDLVFRSFFLIKRLQ